jgi:hypothetical protein
MRCDQTDPLLVLEALDGQFWAIFSDIVGTKRVDGLPRQLEPAMNGIRIQVLDNVERFTANMDTAARRQIPFALARALTWTAKDAQTEVREDLPKRFPFHEQPQFDVTAAAAPRLCTCFRLLLSGVTPSMSVGVAAA